MKNFKRKKARSNFNRSRKAPILFGCGWIEIGQDDDSQTFVRALDMGGMVWEGKPKYKSVDAALDDLEASLEKLIEQIKE